MQDIPAGLQKTIDALKNKTQKKIWLYGGLGAVVLFFFAFAIAKIIFGAALIMAAVAFAAAVAVTVALGAPVFLKKAQRMQIQAMLDEAEKNPIPTLLAEHEEDGKEGLVSKVTDAILNKKQFGPGRNAPELDLLKGRPGWHPGQEVEEVGPLLNQELLRTDVPTPSGRIYPREEVQRALDSEPFKKSMRLRALRGESESPKMPPFVNEARRIVRVVSIDEKLVSHEISDVVIDEAGVVRGTVKAVGPHKAALENLIRGGYQPTFGIRALAKFKKVDGVEVVEPGSLKIMTFDLTGHQEGPKEDKPAFWPDNPLEG